MSKTNIFLWPRSIVKECPFNSAKPEEWLTYLNKLELEIRSGRVTDSGDMLVSAYDTAVETLPEDWKNETYTVIMMRHAILKSNESFDEHSVFFVSLAWCCRSNSRLMIALAYYYNLLGESDRIDNVLNKAKNHATTEQDRHAVDQAIKLFLEKRSLRPLITVYDYFPYKRGVFFEKTRYQLRLSDSLFQEAKSSLKIRHSLYSTNVKPSIEKNASWTMPQIDLSGPSEISDSASMDISPAEIKLTDSVSFAHGNGGKSLSNILNTSSLFRVARAITKIVEEEDENDLSVLNEHNHEDGVSQLPAGVNEVPAISLSSECGSVRPHSLKSISQPVQLVADDKENLPYSRSSFKEQVVTSAGPPILSSASVKTMQRPLMNIESPNLISESQIIVDRERFSILRKIGRGGFSTVYSVLNQNRELRALKRITLNDSSEVLSVAQNEVNLLMSLRDSGRVINLFKYEFTPTHLDLVMEMAEQNLKLFIQQRIGFSPEKVLSDFFIIFIWTEMLQCVKVLHDKRIVHLDLKLENFVLVQGCLKLIDLGISQRLPMDCTHMNLERPMGSIAYISPEQLASIGASVLYSGSTLPSAEEPKVRLKTDIWALGIMLYEMLHGHTPFHRMKPTAIMCALTNPQYNVTFPPASNQSLDKALRRCLSRDPHTRATVHELLKMRYCSCS